MGYSPWGHRRVRHNLATKQQHGEWGDLQKKTVNLHQNSLRVEMGFSSFNMLLTGPIFAEINSHGPVICYVSEYRNILVNNVHVTKDVLPCL